MGYTKSLTNKNTLIGKRFGILEVIDFFGLDNNKKNSLWICVCDCGEICLRSRPNLKRSLKTSCGCLFEKIMQEKFQTHGKTFSTTYTCWVSMKTRCLNQNCKGYKNYGGRGITICNEWKKSFENFLKDMGECPDGYSLERLENNDGYHKKNCEWIPKSQQSKNRRGNYYINYNGCKLTAKEFSAMYSKYNYVTVLKYIKNGYEWKLLESSKIRLSGTPSDKSISELPTAQPLWDAVTCPKASFTRTNWGFTKSRLMTLCVVETILKARLVRLT